MDTKTLIDLEIEYSIVDNFHECNNYAITLSKLHYL